MSREKTKRKNNILIKIKQNCKDGPIEDYYELEEDLDSLEELKKSNRKRKSKDDYYLD